MEWLAWEEKSGDEIEADMDEYTSCQYEERQNRIAHFGNGYEFKIPNTNYKADGYDARTNTIYEFYRCFWHGCPKCSHHSTENHSKLLNRSHRDVYDCTMMTEVKILEKGFNLKKIWECQWNEMKASNPEIPEFLKDSNLQSPLEPRDAFKGGRVNATRLYHKAEPAGKINYYD